MIPGSMKNHGHALGEVHRMPEYFRAQDRLMMQLSPSFLGTIARFLQSCESSD